MTDKQNPRLDKEDSLPVSGDHSRDESESAPKSYYYDDATGYEIYKDESDDDDDESS